MTTLNKGISAFFILAAGNTVLAIALYFLSILIWTRSRGPPQGMDGLGVALQWLFLVTAGMITSAGILYYLYRRSHNALWKDMALIQSIFALPPIILILFMYVG